MAGTRGGLGRIAAMVVGLAVLICLLAAGTARAGTYEVAQCGWGIGAELDPAMPKTEGDAVYLHPGYCTAPPAGTPAGLWFETGYAADGGTALARARWAAPPGTSFASISFTWSGELQNGMWQVAASDDGVEAHGLVGAVLSSAPHPVVAAITGPAPAVEVRLECLLHGGPVAGCTRSLRSSMLLSGVTLTVGDPVPPQAKLAGALVAAGWHRGTVSLELGAEDAVGAGLAREEATVDGAPVLAAPVACAVATIDGEVRGTRLRPCPPATTRTFEVDTTKLADGIHTLRGCAVDFSGGQGCAPDARIEVDNSAPEVEFGVAPEGEVAATVSDAFSGPAAGTISVRRADSDSWTDLQTTFDPGNGRATLHAQLPDLSAGAYFFRATATDAAGNTGSAQFRAAGSAAKLRRQVGGGGSSGSRGRPTHLVAYLVKRGGGAPADRVLPGSGAAGLAARGSSGSPAFRPLAGSAGSVLADRGAVGPRTRGSQVTVDYGTAVEVRGRLTDADRAAVAGRPVAVVARAAAGTKGEPEPRRVVTDRDGRFELRLPPGTSRRVLVSFHGGGGLAPAHHRPLSLRVRAWVSLAATPHRLRTGERVTLSGRVRAGSARIPARGKLVTVQYLERASGRWRPALVVRTGARGRFKARYRFRYVTGAARIRLRATAVPEAGWPYASGSSAPVTVEVRGRQTRDPRPFGASGRDDGRRPRANVRPDRRRGTLSSSLRRRLSHGRPAMPQPRVARRPTRVDPLVCGACRKRRCRPMPGRSRSSSSTRTRRKPSRTSANSRATGSTTG